MVTANSNSMHDTSYSLEATIAVGGRFHAFKLAEQLQHRGYLKRIITSNPRFSLKAEKVDPDKIITFPLAEVVAQSVNRLTRSEVGNYWKSIIFDKFVSTKIDKCDAFISWAGFCRSSMEAVKRNGAKIILDRSCPHILDQASLVEEEAADLGMKYSEDRRIVERMVAEYELADVIVVPSIYSQKSFLDRGFEEKKVRIARLSGKFPGPPSLPQRESHGIFRVLYLGGFFLRKGLAYLLRAWNELNLKNAELILRTSDRLDNPEIRRLLTNPTIQVVGYQADLAPLYSQASIFCLPSVDDGFGMAVLEAMSYGLPVIITHNVGAGDYVRDGIDGFIVGIRDVNAIKENILYLYEHEEERKHMGEAAKDQVQKLSWDSYGDTYLSIIREVVGPEHGPSDNH